MKALSVLLVEDDPEILEVTEELFRSRKFEVFKAASVAEAKRVLQGSVPGIVLLDVAMAGEDGITLLRHIKRDPRLSPVPVVLVTGVPRDALPEDASLALAVLRKPVEPGKLGQLIQTFCERMAAQELPR